MSGYATLLAKSDDARRFESLAGQLKTAFNAKFYNPQAGCYDNGSQTSASCRWPSTCRPRKSAPGSLDTW